MAGPSTLTRSAYSGRNQGPEYLGTINVAQNQTVNLNRSINLFRPLASLLFRLRMRVVISVAPYTSVAAEAPYTFLSRLRITGTWRGQQLVPCDLSGATLFVQPRLFNVFGNDAYFGTTPPVRQADPGQPYAQATANFGDAGTYDLDILYHLPMNPIIGKSNRARLTVPYYWRAEDWQDTLQVYATFGDATSFGDPTGATVAISAFGSGSGTPTLDIFGSYVTLGPLAQGYQPAVVIRAEQVSSASLTQGATALQIFQLQKQKTTRVLLKTGQAGVTTSPGSIFASLDDLMLDQTQVQVDNKPIRNNLSNIAFKSAMNRQQDTNGVQGYFLVDFIDSQDPRTAFRADNPNVVGGGSQFNLTSNVVAPGNAPLVTMIQEQILSVNGDPYWGNGSADAPNR
jgi:hypothetical protein